MANKKDKLAASDIATVGISVALIIVIGMVVVVALTKLVPILSSMVVFATPLMTMVFTVAALRTRRIGVVSLICLVFGLIMLRVTSMGVVAVVPAALIADLVTKLIFGSYDKNKYIVRSTPLMCTFGVWTAFLVMNIFTPEDSIFTQGGILATLLVTIFVYILAYIVSRLTVSVFSSRIGWAREPAQTKHTS